MTIDSIYNVELEKLEFAKKYFAELPKISLNEVKNIEKWGKIQEI